MKSEYNIRSVEKALHILRLFTSERPEMSVTEINRELGLTYSTSFRLLATLEINSFLYKNPSNLKYSLGPAIPMLNSNYVEIFFFKDFALEYLQLIMQRFGETAVLYAIKSVKNNLRICVARVESSHRLRSITKVNDELVLTRGGCGQILVANLQLKDQKYLIGLEPTLTFEKLEEIKMAGYASNAGGRIEGTAGIAVPIFDPDGKLLASIGISGASSRFNEEDLEDRVAFLKECSEKITKKLASAKQSVRSKK